MRFFLLLSAWYLRRQDFLVASPAYDVLKLQCVPVCVFVCVCFFYQNQLVDVCEKIQLQALRIERFIDQTLTAKEQKLQVRNETDPHPLNHTVIIVLTHIPQWKLNCFTIMTIWRHMFMEILALRL